MNRITRRVRRVIAVAAGLLVAGGCAIQPDSAPRDIDRDLQGRGAPSATAVGGVAGGTDRIFLLAPDGSEQLRTVQRDTDGDPATLLSDLIDGPNPSEFQDGYRSAVPATLELYSVRLDDDAIVQVDLTDDLLDLTGSELTRAVAQIVFTASELPGAESVLIRVDGATQEWPDGSGAQHLGPLTTYDFVGYAESAQPAFPVSPAPTTAVPPSTTAPATTTTTSTTTTTAPAPAPTSTVPATTVAATTTTVTTPAPTTTAA